MKYRANFIEALSAIGALAALVAALWVCASGSVVGAEAPAFVLVFGVLALAVGVWGNRKSPAVAPHVSIALIAIGGCLAAYGAWYLLRHYSWLVS